MFGYYATAVVTGGSWCCLSQDVTTQIGVSMSFISSLSDAANQHSRHFAIGDHF